MNEIVKQKWVAALRSGEFEQCDGALRIGDKFCCLGVLSELAVRDGVIEPAKVAPDEDYRASRGNGKPVFLYDNEAGRLPTAVAEWAGLTYEWEEYDGTTQVEAAVDPSVDDKELSILNDDGATFAEIADIIERGL